MIATTREAERLMFQGAIARDIAGFPGYKICDDGSVWSRKHRGKYGGFSDNWRLLKSEKRGKDYSRICLCVNTRIVTHLVHRLVLEAFIGPCPPGMECCHENGNKKDNRLSNLRWDTRQANSGDAIKHGTMKRGVLHHSAKLTESKVKKIREMYATGRYTTYELADRFDVDRRTVVRAIKRLTWAHVI